MIDTCAKPKEVIPADQFLKKRKKVTPTADDSCPAQAVEPEDQEMNEAVVEETSQRSQNN